MSCSTCHPSHSPSCYTTHFWVKQRQEKAPGNRHRLTISRENLPDLRREQTSHTMKRIMGENIFCFKVMFQNLDYLEQRCWAGGKKKMNRKREMNQCLKAMKTWKMMKWGTREKPWPVAPAPSKSEWRALLLLSEQALLDKGGGVSRRRRALQTCGSH